MEKKRAITAASLSLLLFSVAVEAHFVNFGVANPVGAEFVYKELPIISIHSPMNNDTFSVNTVLLSFTVTKPDYWLVHGGYDAKQILKRVRYQIDGEFYNSIPVNSDLESPFDYSVNLTNLTDGVHSLQVYADASGWLIEMHMLWEHEVSIGSMSEVVYFNVDVDLTPPTILVFPVENKTYDTTDFPLNFTVNEPVSKISYSLYGQDNVTIAGNTTLTNVPYGDHNVTVYATDKAGNTGTSETIIFSISKPEPQPEIEPFSTTLVVAASIASASVITVGLLVYFKKRKH